MKASILLIWLWPVCIYGQLLDRNHESAMLRVKESFDSAYVSAVLDSANITTFRTYFNTHSVRPYVFYGSDASRKLTHTFYVEGKERLTNAVYYSGRDSALEVRNIYPDSSTIETIFYLEGKASFVLRQKSDCAIDLTAWLWIDSTGNLKPISVRKYFTDQEEGLYISEDYWYHNPFSDTLPTYQLGSGFSTFWWRYRSRHFHARASTVKYYMAAVHSKIKNWRKTNFLQMLDRYSFSISYNNYNEYRTLDNLIFIRKTILPAEIPRHNNTTVYEKDLPVLGWIRKTTKCIFGKNTQSDTTKSESIGDTWPTAEQYYNADGQLEEEIVTYHHNCQWIHRYKYILNK